MKYLILSICFFASFSAIAQQKLMDVDLASEKMAKLYDLDDTQKNLCKGILKTKVTALNDLNSKPMDLEESQKEREVIEEAYSNSFEDILNPEQKLVYQRHRSITQSQKRSLNSRDHLKIKKAKSAVKPSKY